MTNAKLNFEKVNKLIFFGGTPLMANLIDCAKDKFDIYVFTSNRFINEIIAEGKTFQKFLEEMQIPFYIEENINSCVSLVSSFVDVNTLAISVSAPWIFKKDIIDIFNKKFINIHRSLLPEARGGGGLSWTILQNKNKSGYTYHLMTEGIDDGPIIYFKEIIFPQSCYYPIDFYKYLEEDILRHFQTFLKLLREGHPFDLMNQHESFSSYYPRLNQEVHSYINWNWSGEEILNFIRAFSYPFKGAKTLLNGNIEVHIKDVLLENNLVSYHPFQYGLIYKKDSSGFYAAAKNASLLIKHIYSQNGELIDNSIKLGDRLYTPQPYLDKAMETRVFYEPGGNIKYANKV